ncbi:MAG: IPT/TIG domain-containing protein, partial [Actinomycetes bacterium]
NAYVYWTNDQSVSDTLPGSVGRSLNDGTLDPNPLISPVDHPFGLAIDSSHVYWANEVGGEIWRSNLDGTGAAVLFNPSLFTPTASASAVAVDATHIYWTHYESSTTNGAIWKANLDGTNPVLLASTGDPGSYGIAVDADYVYWTRIDGEGVFRTTLGGGATPQRINDLGYTGHAFGIAIHGSQVYWTDYFDGGIFRTDLTQTLPNQHQLTDLVGVANYPRGLAADSSSLYWVNAGNSEIWVANRDSTGSNPHLLISSTDTSNPVGVAVNPWSQPAPTVSAISASTGPVAGGTPVTITGTGFASNATVTLGGATCTGPSVVSATTLTCTTGGRGAGLVDVVVANPDTQAGTLVNAYTYVAAPTPTRPQTPLNGCVIVPHSIPLRGRTRLEMPRCRTNAGQNVTTAVRMKRGDIIEYQVVRQRNGAVFIKTYGYHLKLRITWYAPAAVGYSAYSLTRTYRTGK